MGSPLDKKVVFGLLYLWIRDGNLSLTEETEQYIKEHCYDLLNSADVEYSDKEIVAFIKERRLVPRLVHHIRLAGPKARRGLTRRQRDLIYRRPRPRARVTALDKA